MTATAKGEPILKDKDGEPKWFDNVFEVAKVLKQKEKAKRDR